MTAREAKVPCDCIGPIEILVLCRSDLFIVGREILLPGGTNFSFDMPTKPKKEKVRYSHIGTNKCPFR